MARSGSFKSRELRPDGEQEGSPQLAESAWNDESAWDVISDDDDEPSIAAMEMSSSRLGMPMMRNSLREEATPDRDVMDPYVVSQAAYAFIRANLRGLEPRAQRRGDAPPPLFGPKRSAPAAAATA